MSEARAKGSGLEWFVRHGGSVRGPVSSARVRHQVLAGTLTLDDEVSADRRGWRRIGAVDEVVPLQLRDGDSRLTLPRDLEGARDRRRALRAILVSCALIAATIGLLSVVGRPGPEPARDCAAAPAPGVFLEGCRLDGAALAHASMTGARLANASLARAHLAGADLNGADLRYVDLSEADLSHARLSGASLKGADLRDVDLSNADLGAADLSYADLSGARIGGAQFGQAAFEGAIWIDGRRCAAGGCPR